MKRVRIVVRGKVQRVGYRYYVKSVADKLSLDGWVKNNADDSVEILAEGSDRLIEEFLEYCRKGPPLAEISKVDISEEKGGDKLRGFEIVF